MTASTQWQLAREAAERYQQILVPTILGPAAAALVEWSTLRDGEAVVDIGCGTGAATRLAAEKVGASGRVVGVDINAGMLEVARALEPAPGAAITWLEESASRLSLDDRSVDVALCAQTLQFLPDRKLALAEIRRVVRPRGRVALSLWCEVRENPYFFALTEAIARHIGASTAAGLAAAFALSDPDEIRALLQEAGLKGIELAARQLDLALPPLEAFVPRHVSATPMASGYAAAPAAARQAVVRDVCEKLASHANSAGARIRFSSYLVTAAL